MPVSSNGFTARHRKQKPDHSLGQNIVYMISLAWKQRRSVILLALTMAVVAILLSLTQLFIVLQNLLQSYSCLQEC